RGDALVGDLPSLAAGINIDNVAILGQLDALVRGETVPGPEARAAAIEFAAGVEAVDVALAAAVEGLQVALAAQGGDGLVHHLPRLLVGGGLEGRGRQPEGEQQRQHESSL